MLSWIHQYSPYGVISLDKSLAIQSWNHWMEAHTGKALKEVAGSKLPDLYPDLQKRKLFAPLERALAGESSVLSTALHRYFLPMPSSLREHGEWYMRQTARVSPLVSKGEICGVVIVIEDVTQRETQAELLIRQHQRDEILSWTLSHFLKTEEPRKTVRQLFFKIAEYLDFDSFMLYLSDPQTGSLALHATGGISPELEEEFGSNHPFSPLTDFTEITIFDSLEQSRNAAADFLRKASLSVAIAIPLFTNTRKLGLLCFAAFNRENITKDEAELLTTIGQYLAIALDKEQTSLELKKAQLQLQTHAALLEKTVNERTAKLKETVSELETFSYTLAHDLKAPVRSMTQYCHALLQDFGSVIPVEAKFMVEKLTRTPKKMEALIHDLLEFSKVSRQEVRLSRIEVGPILEEILSMRVMEVREAVTISSPLHAVEGHRALLQQVLANLIDNAIKFVDVRMKPVIVISTGIVDHLSPSTRETPLLFSSDDISASSSKAESRLPQTKYVRISVIDKGIGIPAEAHQKIFGIFERGLNAGVYEGTGMGLAIVARAMQRMNGTCGVESRQGTGSRFWVELPAA